MRLIDVLVDLLLGNTAVAVHLGRDVLHPRPTTPCPPQPEPVAVTSLPLPPVIEDTSNGSCNLDKNPYGTGCIGKSTGLQAGSFLPDGNHVLASVKFVGAPDFPDPRSIYSGQQVIVIKSDGTSFANGDTWKCISCGAWQHGLNSSITRDYAYPQAFQDGKSVLAGAYIISCGPYKLVDERCVSKQLSLYGVRMENAANKTGSGAALRELRLHPDQAHLGVNVFSYSEGALSQNIYIGKLNFDPAPKAGLPLAPRYDLIEIQQLSHPELPPPIFSNDGQIQFNYSAITVGELRGFTGTGREVTYIGYSTESCNIDVYAADLGTGNVRRLTSHPGYVDPIEFSPDDEWFVIMDTRGSNRTEFMDGMRGIPPLVDLVSTTACASVRNNGARRFFQPYLLDRFGDRGDYYGQEINGASSGQPGSGNVDDPEWNGMADPWFNPDGTKIVYWQAQTVSPACGGDNPLPCYNSTEPGGRTERLMLAHLTSRKPLKHLEVVPVPDTIPWAAPYVPGSTTSSSIDLVLPTGNYTLHGQVHGHADVQIVTIKDGAGIAALFVEFHDFSDDGVYKLNGFQNISRTIEGFTLNRLDWYTNLTRVGPTNSTQISGRDGFHMSIDVMENLFEAKGTLTTTVDGVVYRQPLNGA